MRALIAAQFFAGHVLEGRVVEAIREQGERTGQFAAGCVIIEQLKAVHRAGPFKMQPNVGAFCGRDGIFLLNYGLFLIKN